ncbi:ATP synthase delta chain, chloroplastic-like [Impatiens glandulifera]|uniref:ATP synthase delta chain, chloroplastic-like n=1 Tax=Impatiens glandulifera TaxID=253017 RepID=UPI001FB13E15|nr:ATP synthase delta chain, chloroplastic-like [Impatiens glandulifera]
MASLQQTPPTFQSSSSSSSRINATFLLQRPQNLSFPGGSVISIKIPKLAVAVAAVRFSVNSRSQEKVNATGAWMPDSAAGRYANALADVANSNGTLDKTLADIEKIGKIFSDPQIYEFFINPTVILEKKREIVDEIFKLSNLQTHVENFINILIDVNRIELISDIVKEFGVFYNKMTNTELAIVSSVVKLEDQHLAQIAKQVQRMSGARNVRIKTIIEPSLVAGFTIRYGNSGSKLIDMSVKKQLQDLAAQLEIGDMQLPV